MIIARRKRSCVSVRCLSLFQRVADQKDKKRVVERHRPREASQDMVKMCATQSTAEGESSG